MVIRSYFDWGNKPAMVHCKCGAQFRDPDLKKANQMWAAHRDSYEKGQDA
jgi:hypothetical protein